MAEVKIAAKLNRTGSTRIPSGNFELYSSLDKSNLQNKYVVIVKEKVVAKGANIEAMLEEVRRNFPGEIPFVAKVPDENMLVL